ncbi:winged helix-turn-helix domain-containing protein [Nocardia sp. NPDC051570]|uniref:winged helix-turn-helix domain-containing protein n=1 Tax=Nocardia sp. NPDC051570 TaxID=3364324 RepID=UPI003790F9C1
MSSDEASGDAGPGPVHLTNPRAMRALAHPTRLALLELLAAHGSLTATEAAQYLDESPTNCAFHLRALSKYGFVEEVDGGGGRRRPWRRKHLGFSYSDTSDSAESSLAAAKLSEVLWEGWLSKARTALYRRPILPQKWRAVTGVSEHVLFVTDTELAELNRQMDATLSQFRDRQVDQGRRPAGSKAIQILIFRHPQDLDNAECEA